MGFAFTFEQPDNTSPYFSLNWSQMSTMVEVMREVGAIREQGYAPNWTLLPDGVTQDKFQSNANHHVTPDECRLIAERLRAGIQAGTVFTTLSFFDGVPQGREGEAWVEQWADYNERAAAAGGYRVR